MKELKIDPKLKALFKPLPQEKLDELKEKLLKRYDGTPLYVWQEDILVDGHNRYPILKENNINFVTANVEDFLGEDCTRADVMQWMISHQQARRNLELGEVIYANSMVAEEIALENKERQSKGGRVGADITNGKTASVQMDGTRNDEKKSHTSPTHTREQVAKMSGVGVGTVARYDAVMKSDDEELKRKVQTGEVKIGTAYREVKKKENKDCQFTTQQTITPSVTLSKESSKSLIENGVILLEEKTDDDKMMNDIARRMKSGQADLSKISNESELNNIKEIISININSAIAYVRSNLNFDEFNGSDLEKLREIINEATNKMENLMKDMEELVNEK